MYSQTQNTQTSRSNSFIQKFFFKYIHELPSPSEAFTWHFFFFRKTVLFWRTSAGVMNSWDARVQNTGGPHTVTAWVKPVAHLGIITMVTCLQGLKYKLKIQGLPFLCCCTDVFGNRNDVGIRFDLNSSVTGWVKTKFQTKYAFFVSIKKKEREFKMIFAQDSFID